MQAEKLMLPRIMYNVARLIVMIDVNIIKEWWKQEEKLNWLISTKYAGIIFGIIMDNIFTYRQVICW